MDWCSKIKGLMDKWENTSEKSATLKPLEKNVVDSFSTHFLEYELKKEDLLIHLFPRAGGSDRYYPSSTSKDGKYIPGRLEEPVDGLSFPENALDCIERAAECVWAGDVTADYVPELKSYAVQFIGAANTLCSEASMSSGALSKFIDLFSEALDRNLEP
jgi:hypothetical protein